jgi:hypothetical protein
MGMFETLARVMTAPGDTLKVRCQVCGHRTDWRRKEAFERLGADTSPFTARRRLACGRCGERTRLEVWI